MKRQAPPTEDVGRTLKAAFLTGQEIPENRIIKAGELVEAKFARGSAPSAAARKVLALLIQAAGGHAWKEGPHSILKKTLRGSHKGNERLDEIFDELQTILLQIETIAPDGRSAKLVAPVVAYRIEHLEEDDNSKRWWQFSEPARRAMLGSNYYAAINKGTLLAFESRYSVTLYERGCLLAGRRDPRWKGSLEELREIMGVPGGTYAGWSDVRRKVLELAISEVNQLADFTVSYAVKTGLRGKVLSVSLYFQPKDPNGRDAAARELEASRIGRKARRSGTVEDILTPAQRRAIEDLRTGNEAGSQNGEGE